MCGEVLKTKVFKVWNFFNKIWSLKDICTRKALASYTSIHLNWQIMIPKTYFGLLRKPCKILANYSYKNLTHIEFSASHAQTHQFSWFWCTSFLFRSHFFVWRTSDEVKREISKLKSDKIYESGSTWFMYTKAKNYRTITISFLIIYHFYYLVLIGNLFSNDDR